MSTSHRHTRLAWLSQELAKGKSNAAIVLDCMITFPGVSEAVARKDLKELLSRLTEIELECLPEVKTRMLEVGWKLMEEARSLAQMGAAVNLYKTMATIMGVMTEGNKPMSDAPTGTPDAQIVRDRIALLMKNKKIKAEADSVMKDEPEDDESP